MYPVLRDIQSSRPTEHRVPLNPRSVPLHPGEGPFSFLNLIGVFLVGWPAYLLTGASGGPVRGEVEVRASPRLESTPGFKV